MLCILSQMKRCGEKNSFWINEKTGKLFEKVKSDESDSKERICEEIQNKK